MKKKIAMVSGMLMLGTCLAANLSVQAVAPSLESTWSDETCAACVEMERDQWYLDEDGVIYCAEDGLSYAFDPLLPNPGTYTRSDLLRSLVRQYPDAQFAVRLDSWQAEGEADSHLQAELYLHENGVEYLRDPDAFGAIHAIGYAVVTAEQLDDFPVYEQIGYHIGLAKRSDMASVQAEPAILMQVAGDLNSDCQVSLVDVICLQQYLLNQISPNDAQWQAADINGDQSVDIFDLALLKRILIG